MRLFIKQKVFSWVDKFAVSDEQGRPVYYVEGQLFSWGKKLHVYDQYEREVAFIQQKVFSLLPKFYVFVNGEKIAEIVKEFTFLRPKYTIDGLDWEINGAFWQHDYEITCHGIPVVSIHKEWLTWGDFYVMDIRNDGDTVMALAVVLAIDCVLAAAAASNANND